MSDVLIVGGGIGGLATSIAMRDAGWDVRVVEVRPDMQSSVVGVGIIQPINALRALELIGCTDACLEQGYAAKAWMQFLDRDGKVLFVNPGTRIPGSDLPPMNGITRPRLHEILTTRALQAGVEIEYGRTIDSLEDRGEDVAVIFDDASSATFDVVVGADGVRSVVRPYVIPGHQPAYNGQSSFRVTIPREPEIECITIQHGAAGTVGMVPLAPDLAYLFFNTVWDRDRRPDQQELYDLLQEFLAPFGGVTARVRDEHITPESDIVLRPEEWLIVPPPWHKGRIVLIGDAVHTVTPHLGQGAAQAIEDGVVLAEVLGAHDSVEDAFAEYAERRHERCRLVVETGVLIGEHQQGLREDVDVESLRQNVLDVMLQPI